MASDEPSPPGESGFEALPDAILASIVPLLEAPRQRERVAEDLKNLTIVCKNVLGALKRIKLPLDGIETSSAEEAAEAAEQSSRAYGIGHVRLSAAQDLAPLKKCTSMHTLDMSGCRGVTDLLALAECKALQKLDISRTRQMHNQQ